MSTHTPGPWKACERGAYRDFDGASRVINTADDSVRVAAVHHEGSPEDEANTRLIAAAPELLEVLKAIAGNVAATVVVLTRDEMEKIRNVIAKAEGTR